jgi:hypothetical protein
MTGGGGGFGGGVGNGVDGTVGQTTINLKAESTVVESAVMVAVAHAETVAAVVAEAEANVGENRCSGGGIDADRSGNPWLGNPLGIPQNSAINLISDLLNSGIFIQILFFRS